MATELISLSRGVTATIDASDAPLVSQFKWHAVKGRHSFYACACLGKKQAAAIGRRHIKMHRLILGFPDLDVDHRDGNGLNNVRENLRLVTNQLNQANARKQVNGRSDFKGVSWHSGSRQWQVFLCVNNKPQYVGASKNQVEAARMYDAAALLAFGQFAKLNFPECPERESNSQALTGTAS